ncbi:hypothetical protein [Occallatibacter savannae]|uniref:hypothetical protein n=1 Tax=Occallatibacter savannae TaxID=1002691 RepID=UPI000D6987CE|nr:hypothetical protein [Occallatibacter savannae]
MSGYKARAATARLIELDEAYHRMDVAETRKEHARLITAIEKESKPILNALDRNIPYLSALQMLSSQRGAVRKSVLASAGLPKWSKFLSGYAEKYGVSTKKITRMINEYRSKAAPHPIQRDQPKPQPLKLTARQTRQALQAIAVARDAFAAHNAGHSIEAYLKEWNRVAMDADALLRQLEDRRSCDPEMILTVETGERYIFALEEIAYSSERPLSDQQRASLRMRSEPWRRILRAVRGQQQEQAA